MTKSLETIEDELAMRCALLAGLEEVRATRANLNLHHHNHQQALIDSFRKTYRPLLKYLWDVVEKSQTTISNTGCPEDASKYTITCDDFIELNRSLAALNNYLTKGQE